MLPEIRAGRIELLPFGIDIMATNVTPSSCAEAISRSASARLRLAACAATLRQRGQRLERRPRPAEMIEQRAEGPWSDILAADEAEPIDPLLVGEPHPLIADFIPFSVAHFRPAAAMSLLLRA